MASPVVFFRRPAPVPTSDLHSDSDDDAAFPSFTRFPTASPATSDDEDSTPAYKHDNIPAPLNASRIMIHLGDLANLQHQIGIPGIGGLNNILGNQVRPRFTREKFSLFAISCSNLTLPCVCPYPAALLVWQLRSLHVA